MTRSDLEVDDALRARVEEHFDDDATIELTALIAFQNLSSKFNAAFGVPPQGFCRVMLPQPIDEASQARGECRDTRQGDNGRRARAAEPGRKTPV